MEPVSTEDRALVSWALIGELAWLVSWLAIALVHVALVLAVLIALWWTQTSPQEIAAAVLRSSQGTLGEVVQSFGLTAAAALGAYVWVMRKIHRWLGTGHLFERAMRKLRQQ